MAFNMLPTGMSFQRLGKFPLDSSSLHNTLAEAMNYVQNNPTAYPGQVLYIADARTEEEINNGVAPHEAMFMITTEKEVKLVVSSNDLDMKDMVQKVEEAVEKLEKQMEEEHEAMEAAHQAMKDEADIKHAEIDKAMADMQAAADAKHQEMEEAMAAMKEEADVKHAEMEEAAKDKHAEMEAFIEVEHQAMKEEAEAEHAKIKEMMDIQKPYLADLAAYPTSKFLFACGNPMTIEPNVGQKYDAEKPEDAVAFVFRWEEGFEAIVVEKEEAAKIYLVGGHGHDKVKVKRPIPQTNILARNVKIKGLVGGSYFEGMVGHANIEAENCEFVAVMGAGWCGASVNGDATRMNIVDDINMKLTNCKVSSTLFGGSQGNGVADDVNIELNNCEIGWLTAGGSNGMTRNAKIVMNGGSVKVAQSTNRGIVHKAKFVLNDGVVKTLYFGGETEDSTVNGLIEEGFIELNGGQVNKLQPGTNNGVEIMPEEIKGSIRDCVVNEGDTSMLEQFKHMFFGGDNKNVPCANGEEVKALAGKERVDVKEVAFVVPVDSQRVVVAVPESEEVEEIQYMGQGCVDYKDMFDEEVVYVDGEGYKVMTYIFAVPCSAKMTFKIVLK